MCTFVHYPCIELYASQLSRKVKNRLAITLKGGRLKPYTVRKGQLVNVHCSNTDLSAGHGLFQSLSMLTAAEHCCDMASTATCHRVRR